MDPNYIGPTEYEYYKQVYPPKRSNYTQRTPAELTRDINVAHDNLRQQVRINDKLVAWNRQLEKQLGKEKFWRKMLVSALGLTWLSWAGAFWYVFKLAAPLIVKGMAK
jgi:hypothetical protein